MEIGMKEEMGVADKMTLSVLRWGALQLIAQKLTKTHLLAVYCGQKQSIAMEIGMKKKVAI